MSGMLAACISNQCVFTRAQGAVHHSQFHIFSSSHIYSLSRFCKRAVLRFVVAVTHYILSYKK